MKNAIKQLAHDLVNDDVFVNSSVDKIISTIENVYIFKDIDLIELSKYINISQRKQKIIKLNEKILEIKI